MEFLHFLGTARGSALEVQTQLEAAKRLRFGKSMDFEVADKSAAELVLILNAAIRTYSAKIAEEIKRRELRKRVTREDLDIVLLVTPQSLLIRKFHAR